MGRWKTLHSEYHYKTPFGNLKKDICELPDGQVIEGYYVHEYADWVNAVVLTQEGKIVFVEQYRYPANDFFLEIPAGKMEIGETPEEAIIREVKEETGYTSEHTPLLLGEFYVNPAIQTNKVHTFLILEAVKTDEQDLDETEFIDVHLISIRETKELIRKKKLNQLFSVSALYMALDRMREMEKIRL